MPVTPTPPDRSRRPAPEPAHAPVALLAVTVTTLVLFVVAAVTTGQWVFLVGAAVALAAMLVPYVSRR